MDKCECDVNAEDKPKDRNRRIVSVLGNHSKLRGVCIFCSHFD